ncbi:MAG: hypothetical protein ACREIJ_03455 [Nitrospiraceae bacterium]
MNYEQFLEAHQNRLLGYHLLTEWFGEHFSMETPYPPSELTDQELEELKGSLNQCMPLESLLLDLWDWDIHFEDELGDDWYFEAVFGAQSSADSCSEDLANLFLEKCEEYGMDYKQQEDLEAFKALVREEAVKFVTGWRKNIFNRFAQIDAPGNAPK